MFCFNLAIDKEKVKIMFCKNYIRECELLSSQKFPSRPGKSHRPPTSFLPKTSDPLNRIATTDLFICQLYSFKLDETFRSCFIQNTGSTSIAYNCLTNFQLISMATVPTYIPVYCSSLHCLPGRPSPCVRSIRSVS